MTIAPDEAVPAPECLERARVCSHAVSARYFGYPVYLVGGALTDPDPRDIDLVLPLPDGVFVDVYSLAPGELDGWFHTPSEVSPAWRRWARDVAKQSEELTRACKRCVDFKTQPRSLFDELAGRLRQRLSVPIREDDHGD